MYLCGRKGRFIIKQEMKRNRDSKKPTNSRINKKGLSQDLVEGAFIIVGIVLVHFVQMLQDDGYDPIQSYLVSQSNLVGLFTNLCAIVPLTYGKSTRYFTMSGTTYGWSIAGILIAVVIFAQAISMVYPNVPVFTEHFRSQWVAMIAQLILFIDILVLACQEKQQDINYEKEEIH